MSAKKNRNPMANKSDFIRSQPMELSAKEVIEKAKEQGIHLTPTLVYKARRRGGGGGGRPAAGGAPRGGGARAAPTAPSPANGTAMQAARKPRVASGASSGGDVPVGSARAEDLLKAVAAELGLGRALAILQGERARVSAILGE
jgi:hypothetical protein